MDRLLLYWPVKRNVAAKRDHGAKAALAICRVAQRIVMKLPWMMLLVALAAGCANSSGLPPKSGASMSSAPASDTRNVAELRHFYLLSPGPNATLVVTRSDLSDH
jgi:hypothetical protein